MSRHWFVRIALLFAWSIAAFAGTPGRVIYLHTDEEPDDHERSFRTHFARQVIPSHPQVALEVQRVPGRTREDIVAALKPLRNSPAAVLIAVHTTLAQVAADELPDSVVVLLTLADPLQLWAPGDRGGIRTNVTGFTFHVPYDLKHLEILRECVPGIRRVGVIANPFWAAGHVPQRLLNDSTQLLGVSTTLLSLQTEADLDSISRLAGQVDAWFVPDTPFSRQAGQKIGARIKASGKPSIGGVSSHLTHGGLLVYEPVRIDPWPQMARIVALLLSGVPARDIPFERPKLFKLSLSLSAAGNLGIEIPRSILMRANEIRP